MGQRYYYPYFLGQGKVINIEKKESFYKYIKELFYDEKDYKWKIDKYKQFVRENNLNYSICYSVLDDIFHLHIKYLFRHKGFHSFLKQAKKLTPIDNSRKLPIKEGREIEMIGLLLDALIKLSTISFKEKVDFICDHCNTGYTRITILSYFYEGKFEKYHKRKKRKKK